MDATHFKDWLDDMDITAGEAASMLGVKPNTITRYKKLGTPKSIELACEALYHRRMSDITASVAAASEANPIPSAPCVLKSQGRTIAAASSLIRTVHRSDPRYIVRFSVADFEAVMNATYDMEYLELAFPERSFRVIIAEVRIEEDYVYAIITLA